MQLRFLAALLFTALVLQAVGQKTVRHVAPLKQDKREAMEREPSLRELQIYVGKRVRIQASDLYEGVLSHWKRVEHLPDGRWEEMSKYDNSIVTNLPSTYARKEATIVAVQLNHLKLEHQVPNAFGEVSTTDEEINPYADFILKFDDGTLTMATDYPSFLKRHDDYAPFVLWEDLAKGADAIKANIHSVIGRKLYAVFGSELYRSDTSFEHLHDEYEKVAHKAIVFSRLEPLTITQATYSDEEGLVVLKVTLPAGELQREALVFSRLKTSSQSEPDFLSSVSGSLLSAIPKWLTAKETEAIRHGGLFVGMSIEAVYLADGFPEKENDWGQGETQLVYRGGAKYIYLKNGKVANWQLLDQ